MTINSSTPPPMIRKMGPYTVFSTPTSSPVTPPEPPVFYSPNKAVFDSPKKVVPTLVQTPAVQAPPVQPPPQQFVKPIAVSDSAADGSVLGVFKNAVTKVQKAHSSLDDHLARWFGLNQSKYQWALDDYYQTKGMLQEMDVKPKEMSSKMQSV